MNDDSYDDGDQSAGRLPWGLTLLVGSLLVVHAGLAASSAWQKGSTFDEFTFITAGCSYWELDDYHFGPESGNLNQRLVAAPVALSGYRLPTSESDVWRRPHVWGVGHLFLYRMGHDAATMLWRARLVTIAVSLLLAMVVYWWAASLFGRAGGITALAMYALSPTILAHARLATTDLIFSAALLVAVGAFWQALQTFRPIWFLAACAGFAALVTTKFSAIAIAPVLVALAALRLAAWKPVSLEFPRGKIIERRATGALVIAALVVMMLTSGVVAIWASCNFRYSARNDQLAQPTRFLRSWEQAMRKPGPTQTMVALARRHQLLPESFLFGVAIQNAHLSGRASFLNGEISRQGRWTFFPYCFMAKTALPWLGLLAMSAAAALAKWRSTSGRDQGGRMAIVKADLYRSSPLWLLVAVYATIAVCSPLNIGHRHLLPIYPPLCILGGAAGWWLRGRSITGKVVVGALLAGLVTVSLAAWPHYLAFFNRWSGGPQQGYKHLVDSSLDWGQDLPTLKRWLEWNDLQSDASPPVYLAYFGSDDPRYYGLRAKRLDLQLPSSMQRSRAGWSGPWQAGVYCISATLLQEVYLPESMREPTAEDHAWYREMQPKVAQAVKVGHDPAALRQLFRIHTSDYWRELLQRFERLRFHYLCEYLREREPDDYAGYSILIYRLSQQEVDQAIGWQEHDAQP